MSRGKKTNCELIITNQAGLKFSRFNNVKMRKQGTDIMSYDPKEIR